MKNKNETGEHFLWQYLDYVSSNGEMSGDLENI
jgi:hypothetical protein